MPKLDENRLYWIDVIRSFACVCVVLSHSILKGGTVGVGVVTPVDYAVRGGASILFFMISGALVLYKPKPFVPFIKQRFFRVALPMLLWTVVVLLIDSFMETRQWSQLPMSLVLMFFKPQFGTYWFIYVIFGIYMLVPMIATWLEKCERRDLEILLIAGGIVAVIPYLSLIDRGFSQAVTSANGAMYYFGGYLWIAVMGYYLRKYVNLDRFRCWYLVVVAAVIALPFLLLWAGAPLKMVAKHSSLNLILLCCCYFVALKHVKLSDRVKLFAYDFAQHSFGIYLVHELLIKYIIMPIYKANFVDVHYGITIPVIAIVTLVVSYIIVHLLSKLPGSKYFVGL